MSKILHITASIRNDESVSRGLSARLVNRLARNGGAEIIHRDLSANTLPYIDAQLFAANGTPSDERTSVQQQLAAISDELIAELIAADTVVFGVPMYNFSVPATVKAWADLVARAGTTFHYTANGPVGLLEGKRAYVVVASGGTPVGGAADFMTPWLRHFLGFLGVRDVELVAADGIMGNDGEAKIEDAAQRLEQLAA